MHNQAMRCRQRILQPPTSVAPIDRSSNRRSDLCTRHRHFLAKTAFPASKSRTRHAPCVDRTKAFPISFPHAFFAFRGSSDRQESMQWATWYSSRARCNPLLHRATSNDNIDSLHRGQVSVRPPAGRRIIRGGISRWVELSKRLDETLTGSKDTISRLDKKSP